MMQTLTLQHSTNTRPPLTFQKGDLAKEKPINKGATSDGWNSHGSQIEKSIGISFRDRGADG